MIPVGKAMAEALLLEESDESTVSLSDLESVEGEPTNSSGYPNPMAKPFIPCQGCRGQARGITIPKILRPILDFEPRQPGLWNVSHYTHMSASLSKHGRVLDGKFHHVALDCEMVGVGPGGCRSVLARVAIVDYFGNSLLDEFVRVEERVTDYRHHITGITEKDLDSPTAMSYGQCRHAVIEILSGKVLVGHALQNDLQVLGIRHPWQYIRDTATYHQFMKRDRYGRIVPSRLRDLAKTHLDIEIQRHGRPHCPLEDACATMALYRKSQIYWDCLATQNTPPHLNNPTMFSHVSRIYS